MIRLEMVVPIESPAQSVGAKQLQAALVERFGGYSVYEGDGAYRMQDGQVVREAHQRIEVAVEHHADVDIALGFLVAYARKTGQESVYYLVDGHPVLLHVGVAA